MRIAIPYENGNIFQHFGRTEKFKIYDIAESKIIKSELTDTNGTGHSALAGFLNGENVDAVICGNMGEGAMSAMSDAKIAVFKGVTGSADDAAKAYSDGSLVCNP